MGEVEDQPGAAPPEVPLPPSFKLYSTKHVLWASLFGGPLPGAWMIAANFKRMGEVAKGRLAAGLGAAAVALFVVAGYALERKFGRTGGFSFGACLAIGTQSLAKHYQGRAITAHEEAGGSLESRWKATGITVVGIAQTLFSGFVLVSWLQTNVVVGGTHVIALDGMATEADARSVGAVLTEIGAFQDGVTTTNRLEKDPGRWIVTFDVNDDFFQKSDLGEALEPVAKALRSSALADGKMQLVVANGLHKKTCGWNGAERFECQ